MTIQDKISIAEFWSADHRFGIRLNLSHIRRMTLQCTRSYPNETGGILIGLYNSNYDCAEVTDIFCATRDSKKGKTWFLRGVHGLQNKLNELWIRQKGYYLGEWHFHPGGTPIPSQIDMNQMFSISSSSRVHCPEPTLIIFAGTNPIEGISYRAYVFSKRKIFELA